MSLAGRVLRIHRSSLPRFRRIPVSHDFSPRRNFAPPTATLLHHPAPSRHALDPLTFALGAVLSAAVAYAATQYGAADSPRAPPDSSEGEEWKLTSAAYPLTMAPSVPPGRPGNLTSEQEVKLKEMWTALLDIFGIGRESTGSVDGDASAPATPAAEGTAEGKKKRKARLSLFRGRKGSKDSDGDSAAGADASGADNDKHGQTKEFQQALASQTPEQLREAFWSHCKHDHPDALLLRYLRARKWDVHAALVMLVSTMHWRIQDMHVDDDIMARGEPAALRDAQNTSDPAAKKEGEDFLAQMRLGKSFVHGIDKEGRPCCYVRVRLHRQGEQSERSLERFTVYTIETTRMMLRPPVDTATLVFDMTDFSMANMDYTPVKFMIKCFEANYPESLGSVLVFRAPWIFQGIWKIIRGWLDPVVASKVHFASHVEDLAEWIPRGQIMAELGGDEAYKYAYVEPQTTDDAAVQDGGKRDSLQAERNELVASYETETLAWAHGDDAEGPARNRLAERLAENYWRLDPHVRARSLYDRIGVIGEGGRLDFYPRAPEANGAATAAGNDDVD